MKKIKEIIIEEEDLPFGPPPKDYNYRCSKCNYEVEVNEAVIDGAVMWLKYENKYSEGVMPDLDCPGCDQKTMKYRKD